MNEARILQVKNPYTINNAGTANKLTRKDEQACLVSFPRSVEEIYSMGMSLQYYIGDIYLKLAGSKGPYKSTLEAMAMAQLVAKNEIQKLANENLNEKLAYFYNNGGPVIEPPISINEAKELNGFFNRIITNYMNQINSKAALTAEGELDPKELGNEVNSIIIGMFNSLANLYNLNELKRAFLEMARIKAQC